MTIHREGIKILVGFGVGLLLIVWVAMALFGNTIGYVTAGISIILYALIINFFRYQARKHPEADSDQIVVAPADGKVVVIEEVFESQILNERCLQVSIFMNVFNMHVNWVPVNGVVVHASHQEGRFMAANLPKASTENERSAVVIQTSKGQKVLVRQVAGAVARRIVTYPQVGDAVRINDNLGFIKFGSRVDLYLPLGSKILVRMGELTKGNITEIAELP